MLVSAQPSIQTSYFAERRIKEPIRDLLAETGRVSTCGTFPGIWFRLRAGSRMFKMLKVRTNNILRLPSGTVAGRWF